MLLRNGKIAWPWGRDGKKKRRWLPGEKECKTGETWGSESHLLDVKFFQAWLDYLHLLAFL